MTLNSVFKSGGYNDCRMESLVKMDRSGRRLEIRYVEFDGEGQRVVKQGPVVSLDSTDSRNPAIIRCELKAR
jgi:hypothetical protein